MITFERKSQLSVHWITKDEVSHRRSNYAIHFLTELPNGKIIVSEEYYYLNNKFHRTDGPAIRCWLNNGKLHVEEWFVKGEQVK